MPSTGESSDAELAERYGRSVGRIRHPERWSWAIAGVMTLAVLGVWLVTGPLRGPAATISQDVVHLRVEGPGAVEVDYIVSVHPGSPLACTLEARNSQHGAVGWLLVELPPSEQALQAHSARIVTVSEASTVIIRECWVP